MADSPKEVYASYALDRLGDEHQLRASMHTRAVAVVSTSGVILTLLFSLQKATSKQFAQLDLLIKDLLFSAIVCFLAAAVAALYVIFPRRKRWLIGHEVISQGITTGAQNAEAARIKLGSEAASCIKEISESNTVGLYVLGASLVLETAGIVLVGIVCANLLLTVLALG